jgi:hypothetical protein
MGGFGGKTIFWRELWNSVFQCVQAWKRMETYKSGHSEHFHFCAKIMLFVNYAKGEKKHVQSSLQYYAKGEKNLSSTHSSMDPSVALEAP